MPTSIHGTNGITFNDGSTQNTRPAVGFRNRIINGDMRIDQRFAVGTGSSSQLFLSGTRAFALDRFSVLVQGNTVTGQRLRTGTGLTDGRQFVYQLTGANFVTSMQFEQRIEASNSYDLAGQNVTISVDISNSGLTSVSWALFYPSALDNFTTVTQIATGTWTVSSTMTRYAATVAIPAGAPYINGLSLVLSVGAQVSGTWRIANVQLEPGSSATVFEHRPIGTELALCQRYYNRHVGTTTTGNFFSLCNGYMFATTQWETVYTFPVEMRVAPSFSSSALSTFQLRNTNTVPTSLLPYLPSTKSVLLYTANAAVGAAGYSQSLGVASASTGFLEFSAEL